ncbi:MAG: NADH-quinone oxidoreductase subunit C [Gemmataceae bacterium]|nr:NADH-quinone oxidoreductase subunit C [Gemmataceae bacterium]
MAFEETVQRLTEAIGADQIRTSEFRDNRRVIVSPNKLYAVLQCCRDTLGFDMLFEQNGIDYLKYPGARDRFGVVYGLLNMTTGERLFVKVFLNEPDLTLPSAYPLWKGAEWMEREIYDMFGIEFEGHPDLRRILMPPEFTSFPLRKDYPMRGRGERHNFPVITRAES